MLEFKKITSTAWENGDGCRLDRMNPWWIYFSRDGSVVRDGTIVIITDIAGELVLLNFFSGYATIPEGIELPDSFVMTPQVSGVVFA